MAQLGYCSNAFLMNPFFLVHSVYECVSQSTYVQGAVFNDAGRSEWSEVFHEYHDELPGPPSIHADRWSDQHVRLTYTPPLINRGTPLTGRFRVKCSFTEPGNWDGPEIIHQVADGTKWVVGGLNENKTYWYIAEAENGAGFGPPSEVAVASCVVLDSSSPPSLPSVPRMSV